MKRTLLKVLWILTSIFFLGLGIVCIVNPEMTVTSLGVLLGIFLVLVGIFDVVVYFDIHQFSASIGWLLLEGILTILFGVLCLSNQILTSLTIPMIFSIWMLFSGVSRIVSSLDYKEYEFDHWWVVLLLGILLVILGVVSLLNPIVATFTISYILGVMFLSQGIELFAHGYYLNKVIRKFTKLLK